MTLLTHARAFAAAASLLLAAHTSATFAQSYTDPEKGYTEEAFMDMEFEPNLATPVVGAKEKAAVARAVRKAADALKSKYTIDLMRNDEVFVITIPTDELFLPNDTLLSDRAGRLLSGIIAPMRDPLAYKIVLAMHTDDTGSETYREDLSTARLNSVYDWFMEQIDAGRLNDRLLIIPFSMSGSMPLVPNDSRDHRRENRRLEVYFVPGPSIIKAAHKGHL